MRGRPCSSNVGHPWSSLEQDLAEMNERTQAARDRSGACLREVREALKREPKIELPPASESLWEPHRSISFEARLRGCQEPAIITCPIAPDPWKEPMAAKPPYAVVEYGGKTTNCGSSAEVAATLSQLLGQ